MRVAAALLGAAVLALAWLPAGAGGFVAHMARHVAVVAVASPLLALAIAGGRLDPVARAPRLASPLGASMVELVGVWAWHAPALHHAARHGTLGHGLEQATFLGTGVALWVCAVGGGPEVRRTRALGGVAGLLFTSMHMTLLGALLSFARRPLYGHATEAEQQLGGAIMVLGGGALYLAGAIALVADVLREPPRVPR